MKHLVILATIVCTLSFTAQFTIAMPIVVDRYGVADCRYQHIDSAEVARLIAVTEHRSGLESQGLMIIHAIFDKRVVFHDLNIKCPLIFDSCEFKNLFMIYESTFLHGLKFRNCAFAARFQLHNVKVQGGDLWFSYTEFRDTCSFGTISAEQDVNISHCSIDQFVAERIVTGGNLYLSSSHFRRKVYIAYCDIRYNLEAGDCKYDSACGLIHLNSSHIHRQMNLQHDTLDSPISVSDCFVDGSILLYGMTLHQYLQFYSCAVGGSVYGAKTRYDNSIYLQSVECGSDCDFNGAEFYQSLDCSNIRVKNTLNLNRARFHSGLSVVNAHVNTVELGDIHSDSTRIITLDGFDFERLHWNASSREDSCEKAFRFFEGSNVSYSKDLYVHLDTYFAGQGYNKLADEAFFTGIEKEPIDGRGFVGLLRCVWRAILGKLAGYGRRPEYTLGWILLIILCAAQFVFRNNLDKANQPLFIPSKDNKSGGKYYNRFLYAFDLFIPVADLHVANQWDLNPEHSGYRWRANYEKVHRLLGWLLVPIGFAAITGILK